MNVANPAYLWAFMGLIIPVAIHLWSRREGKIIKVGSIRYFPRSESKKSRSIRLNELVLLLLRSVLVSLLVFALAGLKMPADEVKKPAVLVDSEILRNGEYSELMDSLRQTGQEMRWFAPQFPVIDDSYDSGMITKADYWDLIAAIDQLGLDSITVYSKSRVSDFRGDRSGLTTVVDWITLPNKQGQEHIIDAFETSSGLVKCLLVSATEERTGTAFQYVKDIDKAVTRKSTAGEQVKLVNQNTWVTIRKPESTKVSIWYDTEFGFDAQYIDAAMKA
ncbi:MAG: BatA domain-containing protein, partial [Bacteroidota bacterium]